MKISFLTSLLIVCFLIQNKNVNAFVLSKQAEISVLTCSPGTEAYSVYGHSAIRITDKFNNYDVVFNYGIFDFSTPNFVYRFAKGQTDYMLGAYRFSDFLAEYIATKRSVYEQVLNLTQNEKQKVFDFLVWNAQPENRIYRYNFFFDNCATRVRDVIMEQSDGKVIFPTKSANETFRELIKDYHSKLLWLNFGIDLVVAAPADKKATAFEEMFLPDYIMKHFANSKIKTGEETRPLVKSSGIIYQAPEVKIKSSKITSPFVVFGVLLLAVIYVSVRQFRKKKINFLADYLVFGINGFVGIVMLWFVLYSEHPAMHPNYNLMWAIPANLIFAVILKVKKWRFITQYYFVLITVWLLLFMISSPFLPQKFHVVFYIIVLIMLSRSLLNSIYIFRKPKFQAEN